MYASKVLLMVFLTYEAIVGIEGTILRDAARTFPSDLSSWSDSVAKFWSSGRFWEWPKSTAASFLRLVAFPDTRNPTMLLFRHDDGPRASQTYQQRFGFRGERLIESLGTGFNLDCRQIQPPMLKFVLMPPLPS